MITFEKHASISAFGRLDGRLTVGGIPIDRLAQRVGRTPFYAYSRSAIESRVKTLRAVLPSEIHLHYAMKANPMPAVVQLLAGLTDGIDVASVNEMQVALDTGIAAERISFAGPAKAIAEVRQAVAAGIVLNLESFAQYHLAVAAGNELGLAPRLAIRVNPGFELKGSGMRMGGGPKPFGIDEDLVPQLLSMMKADGMGLTGFHIYSGSQNLNANSLIEAQSRTVDLALNLLEVSACPVEWINIGGGFGVPYFPNEKPLDIEPIGEALQALVAKVDAKTDNTFLALELGRYLVAEAGVYVCRIVDRKDSRGQTYLVVDGGLHHNLAASGNFGQVIRKNYPVAVANRLDDPASENVCVTGPLCTPLDLLADRMMMPHAQVGDLIAVFMGGAYGLTASPEAFLSHPAARQVLV